ncbi:hypothetical protein D0864_02027 [Hortaea werneckii]|uniref:Uncharacterized protein n=1 Tax=Hortaea werneckii TaxID=91943 RepID=A0A3M7H2P9_HORWE|nr:hypothetical protein KC323_g4961 [Hortaea werneckii]KAI6868461.1 hypothetical protein KC338_g3953 [Hortaea werneckii]RMZ07277.1 hypothetical protein D0864_02027 [Hortaea werneckii]
MNIGQIPGYYYDEVKKKYFKIQANHVAPAGAKYSKANVNREKRESKRRRLDEHQREYRYAQTVRPSGTLSHPLTTASLGREIGLREPPNDQAARESYIVSALKPEILQVEPPNATASSGSLFGAFEVQHPNFAPSTLLAYNHGAGSSIYNMPLSKKRGEMMQATPNAAFNTSIVSMHVCCNPDLEPKMIACLRQPSGAGGNLFIGDALHQPWDVPRITSPEFFVKLGHSAHLDPALWASAIECHDDNLAVSGSEGVYVIDVAVGQCNHHPKVEHESKSIAWLDPQVIAFSEGRKVALYDCRSGGKAIRYTRPKNITGLTAPGKDGLHILISDNKRLELFDTRMDSRPLFGIRHIHAGPQLEFSCLNDSVVAALSSDNEINTYSLLSGEALKTLPWVRTVGEPLFGQLRWIEDREGGPVLQACHGKDIVRWSFPPTEC